MNLSKMTTIEYARLFGVTPSTVHSWVRDKHGKTSSARRLMEVFQVLDEQAPWLLDLFIAQCRTEKKKPGPAKGSTYVRSRKSRRKPEKVYRYSVY